MSINSTAQREVVVPGAEDVNYPEPGATSRRSEPETCAFCYGTGMEVVPGKGARRCCCCRRLDMQSKLLEAARIPRRYKECSLSNYDPARNYSSQLLAFNCAYQLMREYPAIERGILFMGTVGVGKTHLSVAILRGLIERGVSCLFYEFGSLLREIQGSYNSLAQISEMNVLSPIYEAEVLVLDELGASKPTDWARDMIMQIIGIRYNEKKLTILTTNYLDQRSSPAHETLEDRIGVRLRSRLYEMCQTVVIEGEDYRRHFDIESISGIGGGSFRPGFHAS
jgi:DNA replication protein DnaC